MGGAINNGDRNTLIFRNLVLNDIMAIVVRTFYPVRPSYMDVSAWALALIDESADLRARRVRTFLKFLGHAGFASPDDVEMLEMSQEGYNDRIGVEWTDVSKGLLKSKPECNDDAQMRVFRRRWKALLNGAGAEPTGVYSDNRESATAAQQPRNTPGPSPEARPLYQEEAMTEILALGISHYPPLSGHDGRMSAILRRTLQNQDLPANMRTPEGWPAEMRAEWGDDQGTTSAARHRAALVGWMEKT